MKLISLTCLSLLALVACGNDKRPAADPTSSANEPTITSSDTATPSTVSTSDYRASEPAAKAPATTGVPADTQPYHESQTPSATDPATTAGMSDAPSRPDADNTRVNARDKDANAVTPMDQGNNKTDLAITQQIRKAVVGDGALSFTAKNVKIITKDAKVTLRGPVKSDAERTSIEAKAKSVAGVASVDNQLEVKK